MCPFLTCRQQSDVSEYPVAREDLPLLLVNAALNPFVSGRIFW